MLRAASLLLVLGLSACTSASPLGDASHAGPAGKSDDHHDLPGGGAGVVDTAIELNLAALQGRATLLLDGRGSTMELDVSGLELHAIRGDAEYELRDGVLFVRTATEPIEIELDYAFAQRDGSDGWLGSGSTLLWPYYCGNLFPCRSDPRDGMRFSLQVSGTPTGSRAIYPAVVEADGPAYMPAVAVGDYRCESVGVTPAGTSTEVCYLPEGREDALHGTQDLAAVFNWLERTLGPYRYGDRVASVEVAWGPSAYGGMEHHPLWHVASGSMASAETHAHEAAHGWYGNGIRIACWEDFVLSEGTTSYLAARAIEQAVSAEAGAAIWAQYERELAAALRRADIIAWPESCGVVDILDDGLFSPIVYKKGALFFRALGQAIGPEAVDDALGAFYRRFGGQAKRMQDLLNFIEFETGFDPQPLAQRWLRSHGNPLQP